jgi:hypothetical protein
VPEELCHFVCPAHPPFAGATLYYTGRNGANVSIAGQKKRRNPAGAKM